MHPTDFELEPGLTFGEWLHQDVEENVHLERHAPMPDRAQRVADRLQATRPQHERFVVEVPWFHAFTAFTAPGRYIYVSRRLLERCPDDNSLAFVLAHEMAHHDLGHLRMFSGPFAESAARLQAGSLAVLFFRSLQKHLYSVEWEQAADRRGLELAMENGYDGRKCIQFFHIAEMFALDVGDVDGAFGPDFDVDPDSFIEQHILAPAHNWLWERQRGYLSLRERRALLEQALRQMASPSFGQAAVKVTGA